MKVKEILNSEEFTLINNNCNLENTIDGIFVCDLLSHVMGNAQENNAFITVLNNINVLGVASLLDLSCVIFSHNTKVNEQIISKANELEIPLLSTKLSSAKTVTLLNELGVK